MAEILQPRPGESIYDPTCGSGGMLVKCLDFLRKKGEPWQGVKVFGQEINALTSAIARMNLYLNGVEDFSIVREDTLAHPAFVDGSRLRKFDVVLANPPYSISEWNRTSFENDKWGRNKYGTPPQGRADYAFIQHIVCSMNEQNGRCAILLPHGILFRKEETNVRTNLVLSDKIEAIIGLGPNLFYNAPMEACVIICNNDKRVDLNNKIIFVNAKNEVTRKNAESYLEKIVENVKSSTDPRLMIVDPTLQEKVPDEVNPEVQEKIIVIASERLDAIIAEVYNLSRNESNNLFTAKKVFVNGKLTENNSQKIL